MIVECANCGQTVTPDVAGECPSCGGSTTEVVETEAVLTPASRRRRPAPHRPTKGLVTALMFLFVANGCLAVIATWSTWLEIQLLEDMGSGALVTADAVDRSDSRQQFVGIAQIGLYLLLIVLFAIWMHRANSNARRVTRGMQFTPGWCIGWFFVPIMNLFRPYQAVKEIWLASGGGDGAWRCGVVPAVLPLWWTAWIVSNLLGQASFRLAIRADTLDEVLTGSWFMLVGDALDVPLSILVLLVVRGIEQRQQRMDRSAITATFE